MVKKAVRASKGKECLGVFGTGEKCERARDGSELPIVLNQKCPHCKEQRCRAHCKCGRNKAKTAKGRAGPRGAEQKRKLGVRVTAPASGAAAAAPLRGPVGRAPDPSCQLLDVEEYYARCCKDIASASEVELASYQYDNPSLQKILLKRLKGKKTRGFSLRLYLDTQMFGDVRKKYQRPRVRELRDAGAEVYLCKGPKRAGSFHCKAIVVDRRYLYCGSANATYKSHSNEEYCFRITGPPVVQVLNKLAAQRQQRKPWDGS